MTTEYRKAVEAKAKNILVNIFVRRGDVPGVTVENAKEEWSRLMDSANMESYLTKIRIGSTFKMDRKTRKSLYLSFENSLNHAGFELGFE